PGSAAAAAGLRGADIAPDGSFIAGDVIVGVEGKPVTGVGQLLSRLDDFQVGDTVRLELMRDGRKVEVPVTLQPGT
ncbi:MAG TPA: PDZ domain-containing protein, partial [Pseudomonadales bacterium]|nr:PDZ domain-containing protein [Pseudomonadales bacterium]